MSLFDHQKKALDDFFSRDGKMILNAPVGSGKTAVALTAADRLQETTVYFCPSILKRQVWEEALTWCPNMVPVIVEGPDARVRRACWNVKDAMVDGRPAPVLFVCNKELALFDFEEIAAIQPSFVIIDECHTFNNPAAKRVRALRKLKPKHRLAMSGTLTPNGIHEMFSMTSWVLEPRIFWRSWWEFRERECRTNPWHGITGVYDEQKLLKILGSVSHVVPRDVVRLPSLIEKKIIVDLEGKQLKAYQQMRDDLRLQLDKGEITAINALAVLMRLRQISSHPPVLGLDIPSAKAEALKEILEISTAKKIIVFSEFATVVKALALEFGGLHLTGESSTGERQSVLEMFKTLKDVRLLFLTSMGEMGLNAQHADAVVSFDLPWSHAHIEQRVGRARRTGRTEPVTHWVLIAGGALVGGATSSPRLMSTVDEKMWKLIEKKKEIGLTVEGLKEIL